MSDHGFGERAIQELVGNQLSAVTFVMDYVQLAFDGPMLTVYTWPTIVVGDVTFRYGEPSYRDELCHRIAIRVAEVRVTKAAITLSFADASTIQISLDTVPEAAQFTGRQHITFHPED